MSASLFSRLFIYRERESNTPLENYLTEILAHSLSNDTTFRNKFLFEFLQIGTVASFKISTQNDYDKYGRPDIEIETDVYDILIENKVDSFEGEGQLERYIAILREYKKASNKKILVYLTKHYEKKYLADDSILLLQIRWHEVFQLLKNSECETSQLLKQFLTDLKMDKNLNFTAQDLVALKEIPVAIEKMDELLNRFEVDFDGYFGAISTRASRSSRLSTASYINYVELYYGDLVYWLDIGFNWYDNEPSAWISLEFNIKKLNPTKMKQIIDEELISKQGWIPEEFDNTLYVSQYKKIVEFDSEEQDHVLGIYNYLSGYLTNLIELRNIYPGFLSR